MRNCMICETPYGLLNSMNLAYSRRNSCSFDLYIGDGFRDAAAIAGRIRETGWFAHVWVYRRADGQGLRERLDRKYYRRRYLSDVIRDPGYEFSAYEEIYLASATRFPMCMILACPGAKVYYIDDGFRSYMNDIYVEPLSRLETLACLLAGKRPGRAAPETVYLNTPGMCVESADYEVRQLPPFPRKGEPLYGDICRIFRYAPQGTHAEESIIYLAQALEADLKAPGVAEAEKTVEKALGALEEDVVYRPHPRNPAGEKEGLLVDRKGDMWELVCMDTVTEDTVLISVYSTAMFTPGFLCGKEPWLIFTYPMYRSCLEGQWGRLLEDIETMVTRVRQSYSRPEKVICVESAGELQSAVRSIRSHREERSGL